VAVLPHSFLNTLLEADRLPEWVIRWGIRQQLSQKIKDETQATETQQQEHLSALLATLRQSPIAIETEAANQQHYELPPQFFQLCLGPWRKYSSGLWEPSTTTLGQAEEAMLRLYCQRANIQDGQRILDLGCGWGSVSLWLARHYPNATIVGLSNANGQRQFIQSQIEQLGLTNLTIKTGNIAHFTWDDFGFSQDTPRFDRIISVEMFEHMKNYELLLQKLSTWLAPKTPTGVGQLFVHIFTHKTLAYHYGNADGGCDPDDWMTRFFFLGGTMPSHNLLTHFQQHLTLAQQWVVDGRHYEKTANAWLTNMHTNRANIWPLLEQTYGPKQATKWWVYWKVFYMACAELWGYQHGQQWQVSHYRFENR
jgi:cyclopropane-fatty-acyl-phospholipid synthase